MNCTVYVFSFRYEIRKKVEKKISTACYDDLFTLKAYLEYWTGRSSISTLGLILTFEMRKSSGGTSHSTLSCIRGKTLTKNNYIHIVTAVIRSDITTDIFFFYVHLCEFFIGSNRTVMLSKSRDVVFL